MTADPTASAPQPPGFLDVPFLLEASQPRPRIAWLGWAAAIFLVLVLGSSLLSAQSTEMQAAIRIFSGLVMLGLMALLAILTISTVRKHQREQQLMEGAAELVQLRRWAEAAALLQEMLSRPARTPNLRTQALIYLSAVLARYHRFDDAVAVQNHVLEHNLVDEGTAHGLRLGRAMAMLRQDHLFDADRAINDLRRTDRAGESAGLALVEIYRDVKTGHPEEAANLFESRLPQLRDQLGHRVADAYFLAAKAYDLLGRTTEAADAYTRATLLAPLIELERRYPEVKSLSEKYPPAPAPPEAA